jgi:hypothetical protein
MSRPVALLLAFVAGCGSMQEEKRAGALLATTNNYREAIRWGYWDAAIEFLHPDARDELDPSALDNIRVTGLEVVRPATITPENTAVRLVRIEYVLEDEQRLQEIIDRQDWRWDDAQGAWLLHSGLPVFSAPRDG